jgi:hypothetical protein
MKHSPIINPAAGLIIDGQPTLDFYAALKAVADGKKVAALGWADSDTFGVLADNVLSLITDSVRPDNSSPNYSVRRWIISKEDMDRTDWVILP